MIVCSYGNEAHIITISKDTTLNYIVNEIAKRWKHLSPTMINMKFYIPNNSRMLVTLIADMDVSNMYEIHRKLKAAIIEMVVFHATSMTKSPIVIINLR